MLKWSQMTFRLRLPYCLFPECTKWNKIPFLPAPQCIRASDSDKHLYKKIKNKKKKSQNTFREGKKGQQYWAQNGSNCRVLFNSWSRWRFILKCQKHKKNENGSTWFIWLNPSLYNSRDPKLILKWQYFHSWCTVKLETMDVIYCIYKSGHRLEGGSSFMPMKSTQWCFADKRLDMPGM